MIPYFQFQAFAVGPIQIQVWGLLVALGITLGLFLGYRQAVRRGLNGPAFLDMAAWSLLSAIVASRLFYVLAYSSDLLSDPLSVLRIWEGGMSALGAFLGAGLAFWVFCRKEKLPILDYLNVATFGLPWGYAVGRIGCFLIHDHIGRLSDSFLAVAFPGGSRLDLGLIHVLFGLLVGVIFLVLERRNRPVPYFPLFFLAYGLFRLLADFWRATEPALTDNRWFSLTPTQWLAIPMVFACVWLIVRKKV